MKKRKAEDYRKAAEESSELAHVLAGKGRISDREYLEILARSDELVDHDGETCGQCCYTMIQAQVAREMLEAGEYEDVVEKSIAETRRRWNKTKFVKLWVREKAAGRDPRKAFEKRGWEP